MAKHHGLNHWLMLDLIERKIRLHTDRLYKERGHAEGRELEDWLKAASEVLRTFAGHSQKVRSFPPVKPKRSNSMFTRIVEINTQQGKGREAINTINDKVMPLLKNQPGFVDEIVLVSATEPNRIVALSFWTNKEDAERYNREQYPKVNEILRPLLAAAPTVQTFNVDISTTHKIAAGKAA
jgi:heme-degrading monooxygenase HmoA